MAPTTWRVVLVPGGAIAALGNGHQVHRSILGALTLWEGDAHGRDDALRHGREAMRRLTLAATEH